MDPNKFDLQLVAGFVPWVNLSCPTCTLEVAVLSRSSLCTRSLTIFSNCCTWVVSGKSCPSRKTAMDDRRSTTPASIAPLGAFKPRGASMPCSRVLCHFFTRKSPSTSALFMGMGRRQRRRKAATISDSAGTSTSRETKLSLSVFTECPLGIATAM